MKDLREMIAALQGLGEAMGRFTKAVQGGQRKKSGKTRRGATHTVNPVFLGRKKFRGSPAQYRHEHRGVVTIVPNYLQRHAPPKARNVGVEPTVSDEELMRTEKESWISQ